MVKSDKKFSDWTTILNSVKTPLGFFTLLALILDGVLLTTATLTEKVSLLAPVGLLALITVFVFAIVWRKPYALYHPKDWQAITVNLLLFGADPQNPGKHMKIEPFEVDFDVPQCVLEVRDRGAT